MNKEQLKSLLEKNLICHQREHICFNVTFDFFYTEALLILTMCFPCNELSIEEAKKVFINDFIRLYEGGDINAVQKVNEIIKLEGGDTNGQK